MVVDLVAFRVRLVAHDDAVVEDFDIDDGDDHVHGLLFLDHDSRDDRDRTRTSPRSLGNLEVRKRHHGDDDDVSNDYDNHDHRLRGLSCRAAGVLLLVGKPIQVVPNLDLDLDLGDVVAVPRTHRHRREPISYSSYSFLRVEMADVQSPVDLVLHLLPKVGLP